MASDASSSVLPTNPAELFSADLAPKLEAHLSSQLREGTDDLDANVALLRLYQFYPHIAKLEVIQIVLLQAVARLPRADFSMLYSMLPIDSLAEDVVAQIKRMRDALEGADFEGFWKLRREAEATTRVLPRFDDHVRKFITGVFARTFQRVQADVLARALATDVTTAEFNDSVAAHGGSVAEGTVNFAKNASNSYKGDTAPETVKPSQIAPLIQTLLES